MPLLSETQLTYFLTQGASPVLCSFFLGIVLWDWFIYVPNSQTEMGKESCCRFGTQQQQQHPFLPVQPVRVCSPGERLSPLFQRAANRLEAHAAVFCPALGESQSSGEIIYSESTLG